MSEKDVSSGFVSVLKYKNTTATTGGASAKVQSEKAKEEPADEKRPSPDVQHKAMGAP